MHHAITIMIDPADYVSRAVVIYGPQGCGKSRNAAAIAAFFGKAQIIDPYVSGASLPANAIAFTHDDAYADTALNFYQAAEDASAALLDRARRFYSSDEFKNSPGRYLTTADLLAASVAPTHSRSGTAFSGQSGQGARPAPSLSAHQKNS